MSSMTQKYYQTLKFGHGQELRNCAIKLDSSVIFQNREDAENRLYDLHTILQNCYMKDIMRWVIDNPIESEDSKRTFGGLADSLKDSIKIVQSESFKVRNGEYDNPDIYDSMFIIKPDVYTLKVNEGGSIVKRSFTRTSKDMLIQSHFQTTNCSFHRFEQTRDCKGVDTAKKIYKQIFERRMSVELLKSKYPSANKTIHNTLNHVLFAFKDAESLMVDVAHKHEGRVF